MLPLERKMKKSIATIEKELLHGQWHDKKLVQQLEDANFIRGCLIAARERVKHLEKMDKKAQGLFIRRCLGG